MKTIKDGHVKIKLKVFDCLKNLLINKHGWTIKSKE